jgi:acyl-CoA reductase-like NAD-dependent aldehyde dehydrogenase
MPDMRSFEMIEKGREALFYGGAWQKPHSDARIEVINPADGTSLGTVVDADQRDVDEAVRAAAEAFPAWRATKPVERAKLLMEASSTPSTRVCRSGRWQTMWRWRHPRSSILPGWCGR